MDTPRISRQLSLSTVMESIIHGGPISRASIAKQTGLSKQTISEIARQLEEGGWISETGRTSGHIGRTAVTYEVVPDAACIATVDLGGTSVRAAIADLSCRVFEEVIEPTDVRGGMHVVRQIARMCRQAARRDRIAMEKVRLAVVGVPGAPDRATGRVFMAPNVPALDTFDVKAALADELGMEIILENDVNLAAVGEHWIGGADGVDDLVYIALGTGIGGGIVVAGELVGGFANAAGELAFLPFGADPFEPESLRQGALERIVGTVGIRDRYTELSGKRLDVPDIFMTVGGGDAHAVQLLEETARLVARAVASICAITNPGKVVLGGSIGLREELVARVRELVPLCFPRPVEIDISRLGARVALFGGAAIGLKHLHATLFSGGLPGARIALPAAKTRDLASKTDASLVR